jgi:hypothetical protein
MISREQAQIRSHFVLTWVVYTEAFQGHAGHCTDNDDLRSHQNQADNTYKDTDQMNCFVINTGKQPLTKQQ